MSAAAGAAVTTPAARAYVAACPIGTGEAAGAACAARGALAACAVVADAALAALTNGSVPLKGLTTSRITETPKDRMAAVVDRTLRLADSGPLRVPEGQPIPVEKFSEAVYLAEAPEHGGKPLPVFEP